MTERNIIHDSPGDTLVTDEEWDWIASLYESYPDNPTADEHHQIHQQLVGRFGLEKVEELMQWSKVVSLMEPTPITKSELVEIRESYLKHDQDGFDNWPRESLYAAINGRTELIHRLLDYIESIETDDE